MTQPSSAPDLSPRLLPDTTPAQRAAAWFELLDLSEQFLLAGLRRRIGPDDELRAAYRAWYAKQMEEHDQVLIRMMTRIGEKGSPHGS